MGNDKSFLKAYQCEGEAACGLGGVYQNMGEYEKALEYHQMDLQIAETTENTACQCEYINRLNVIIWA
jgi:tetratricopeptide (TPR) repeat protein